MKHIASGALAAGLLLGAVQSESAVITLDAAARGWVYAIGFANARNPDNNTFTGWGADTSDVNSCVELDVLLGELRCSTAVFTRAAVHLCPGRAG